MTKKSINALILFIAIGFFNSTILGQDSISRKAFISINTGCYLPTTNDFNKIYGDFIFINGLSIGIPFTNQDLFLYGKAMYFRKEGTPIIYHITIDNGILSKYTTQEGLITINHFLFNLGLQYKIKLSDNIVIITNGGLTLIRSNEKSDNPIKYDSKGGGLSSLDNESKYHFKVTVKSCGLCKKMAYVDNWVTVPKLPNSWTVTFEIDEK